MSCLLGSKPYSVVLRRNKYIKWHFLSCIITTCMLTLRDCSVYICFANDVQVEYVTSLVRKVNVQYSSMFQLSQSLKLTPVRTRSAVNLIDLSSRTDWSSISSERNLRGFSINARSSFVVISQSEYMRGRVEQREVT